MRISHKEQKLAWEREHQNPSVFTHLAGTEASGGVKRFWKKICNLDKQTNESLVGLEIGCGKGRNVIWLAKQGVHITGFDFSRSAIEVARNRANGMKSESIRLLEHDATIKWPFQANQFDFVIDCFVSTDIEGENNRIFVSKEILRVLKPGGYFFLYTNSVKSQFYQEALSGKYTLSEKNSYYYPEIKKFEKVYDVEEIERLYENFSLVDAEIYERISDINNKSYTWEHFWRIYKKLAV